MSRTSSTYVTAALGCSLGGAATWAVMLVVARLHTPDVYSTGPGRANLHYASGALESLLLIVSIGLLLLGVTSGFLHGLSARERRLVDRWTPLVVALVIAGATLFVGGFLYVVLMGGALGM